MLIIKNFFLFLFVLLLSHCSETSGLKKLYGKNNLQVNNSQFERFHHYLTGEYYSFDLKRKVSHRPIMFAISEDGLESLIFSCASTHTDCAEGVETYQFLKRYSNKTGKELKIFALKNKIVWGGNSLLINQNIDIKNLSLKGINFVTFTKEYNMKNRFYDISILPSDGKNDDYE